MSTTNGRGAWNAAGVGGTKRYKDATKPGPYYFLTTGSNIDINDPNQYAVRGGVKAYQRALKRRLNIRLKVDGIYGNSTADAVTKFQEGHTNRTSVWGGVGPETSELLLKPDLHRVWRNNSIKGLPFRVCSGTIRQESNWDAGAVGYADPRDVGLAQINAEAHPEWSTDTRLQPINAFRFVVNYYNDNLTYFKGDLELSIAAYNLGKGGASAWDKAGRPDLWTPAGQSKPRNVRGYIDTILKG
jgi:peptidoglycan hydrolase-like protein with peptidoglycan-binding domain